MFFGADAYVTLAVITVLHHSTTLASLVVTTVTKSGLGAARPFGSFSTHYGSFGTYGENFSFGIGNARYGNFLVANTARFGSHPRVGWYRLRRWA